RVATAITCRPHRLHKASPFDRERPAGSVDGVGKSPCVRRSLSERRLGLSGSPGKLQIQLAAGPGNQERTKGFQSSGVEAGRVGYQVLGQEPKIAGPGETVTWLAGTPHRWWNAGESEARMSGWCTPPGNVEYYLTQVFDSMRQNGKRPGLFDAAFLMTRYKSEFGMVDIPKPVQATVIPLMYALGALLGNHRKFTDAPEPVRYPKRKR